MVWLYCQFSVFGDSDSRSCLRLEKRGTGVGMRTTLNKIPRCMNSLLSFFKFEFITELESKTGKTFNLQGKKWIQIMTVL